MQVGTHTKQEPLVDYQDAVKLKKMGFVDYTRASYLGGKLCDWMGWQNDWKLTDPARGFLDDDGRLREGVTTNVVSAPSLLAAARYLNLDLRIDSDWNTIENKIKNSL